MQRQSVVGLGALGVGQEWFAAVAESDFFAVAERVDGGVTPEPRPAQVPSNVARPAIAGCRSATAKSLCRS